MKKYKYKLIISYDGSLFFGYAKQPKVSTVQSTIETSLSKHFKTKINIQSASRTDRYVHAKKQVITIEYEYNKKDKKIIKKIINNQNGIKVKKIEKVKFEFSPRFDALGKTYLYKVQLNRKTAKLKNREYEYQYFSLIDLELIQEDAKNFIGRKNFASFTGKQIYRDYTREITSIKIWKRKDYLYFEIKGKSFMRFMVRNIVGSLLAKNRGKYTESEFQELFTSPIKGKSHYKAPGSGLFLIDVHYKKQKNKKN